MPKKLSEVLTELKTAPRPKWTNQELIAVRHLGPALIGQEMYDASQKLAHDTGDGRYGPALLGIICDQNRDLRKTDDAA